MAQLPELARTLYQGCEHRYVWGTGLFFMCVLLFSGPADGAPARSRPSRMRRALSSGRARCCLVRCLELVLLILVSRQLDIPLFFLASFLFRLTELRAPARILVCPFRFGWWP